MNKRKILLVLFTVVAIVICIRNIRQVKCMKGQQYMIDSLSEENAFIKDAFLLQISLFDNRSLFDLEILIRDSIKMESSVLLYRYSGAMCQSCIDADMAFLSKFGPRIEKKNILILPSKENSKDSRVKVRSAWEGYRCVELDKEEAVLPMDEEGVAYRYFAILDAAGRIKDVFFPNSSSMVTNCYFEYICKKHFD